MTKKIGLASSFWDAYYGEHPSLVENEDAYYSFPPAIDTEIDEHLLHYNLPIIPCVDGHNVMVDSGVTETLDTDIKFCISPNFVRDLAGRIIYIGYGPEKKDSALWNLNRHVSFPKYCRPVTSNIEGSELIGNVLMTRFRCLETSTQYENLNHLIQLSYPNANLYPYKLRLDTFYQDGWRLPQTEMLYVNEHADPVQARKYGNDILAIWDQMQHKGSTYEEFYHKLESTGALEKMFKEGCTYIPTFNGHNGYYDVADDFSIIKRRPGLAVQGLHHIVEKKISSEPKGTILEVIEPGFMTPDHIHPAKVIVSDGERYEIKHKAKGLALCPDLTLPHTRCSAEWGATWIPTEPHHFSAPSIWSWGNQTGHFLQTKGPLWDPLHYYYASTDPIIHAFRSNMLDGSKTFAHIPTEMKKRFYPAIPMKGFDTISLSAKKKALEADARPLTGIIRSNDISSITSIGYHPLPYHFEYELHNWNFPELAPQKRVSTNKSSLLKTIPLISGQPNTMLYEKYAPDINEFERLRMPSMTKDATGDTLQDYPQLSRYLSGYNENIAKSEVSLIQGIPEEGIKPSETLLALSEQIGIKFYKEVYTMRSRAFARIQERNELARGSIENYVKEEWHI